MKLAFIGGGAMAEAIIRGALSASLVSPEEIRVGEVVEQRRRYLTEQYQVHTTPSNVKSVDEGNLVILAVKPQNLEEVSRDLRGALAPHQTVLSIMAGVRMSTLVEALDHASIVRVMPNTPAQIGVGMSLWLCSSSVDNDTASMAQAILKTLGDEIRVHDERYVDMATALSASGPAYVFTFIEALIDAGVYLGLPRPMARRLTLQTVLGSTRLAQESGKHPAELRDSVTSPGGTTVEALLALEEGAFRSTVMNAVVAAYEKSLALSEE